MQRAAQCRSYLPSLETATASPTFLSQLFSSIFSSPWQRCHLVRRRCRLKSGRPTGLECYHALVSNTKIVVESLNKGLSFPALLHLFDDSSTHSPIRRSAMTLQVRSSTFSISSAMRHLGLCARLWRRSSGR